MAPASKDTALILALAEAYCAHTWSTPDSVSGRIFGKGGFFRRLEAGADCSTATARRALDWFAANWPVGLAWPVEACTCGFCPRPVAATAVDTFPGHDADVLAGIAHPPIWKNGRRPAWWSDIGIRRFLTDAHRQMTLEEVVREGRARFGERFPSRSAAHTYWQRLDRVVGQITAKGAA